MDLLCLRFRFNGRVHYEISLFTHCCVWSTFLQFKQFHFIYLFSGSQQPTSDPTPEIPKTSFTCRGRDTGYYADTETDCQVYHMCDQQGRQFSYTCPNTTLFQQRMLVCDHWYMVDCSSSEANYGFNSLIGQRVIGAY